MTDKLPSRPTLDIREALNELLQRNDRTQGKVVGDMFLGSDIFIARLRRPKVLEGDWEDLDRTVDLFDLIDAHQEGGRRASRDGKNRRRDDKKAD